MDNNTLKEPIRNICDSKGFINSVYPCYEYLTFGVWIYLVPQYHPDSVLMLGFAGGTTAGLIRKFYGDIPITGVDVNDCENLYNVDLVKADAREYIKTCEKFDTVIVDMYEDGVLKPCDFIFSKEFSDDIKKKANYIIIHAHKDSDLSNYNNLRLVRAISLNNDLIYYYRTTEIHTLPII